jgi:hypothetical protein
MPLRRTVSLRVARPRSAERGGAGRSGRDSTTGLVACLIAASLAVAAPASAPVLAGQPTGPAGSVGPAVGYGNLPMSFEANEGQTDEHVRFLARGAGYSLFLTASEAVLSLRASAPRQASAAKRGEGGIGAGDDVSGRSAAVVRMRLAGGNNPQLSGLDPLPGKSNYFIGGDPERWRRDVPNYARVKYAGVYPGIDLIYYGNQRQLEYDLVVAPGADPARIALEFEGVQALSLDAEGNLVLHTSLGDMVQRKPVVYQDGGGSRQELDARYVLRAERRVGFQVGSYDTARPLVIDPVLSYSTYLGGNGNDIGRAIAVDTAGNAYVTGETTSTNFPGAATSPIQSIWLGSVDVFVTKLNAAGNAQVYSTYLGGSGGDFGYAIAVDSIGNAYVTGQTDSPTVAGPGNVPFPTFGAIQASYHGGSDAFVTKLNAAGNALVYSTYLGGGGTERGYGIAVDGAFNAYVTGHTSSSNGVTPGPNDFPTAAAFQAQNGSFGNFDAFVTKIDPTGSALVYSTFLGGNASEFSLDGGAIAVDSDGNAYVGGTTASSNFPGASLSTIQPVFGGLVTGRSDGFVVKFTAAGSGLLYSTYLGGAGDDAVNGIAIDASRNAYVVGYTTSVNFPTASPLQASKGDVGSGEDAFVSKLNATGSALVYSTYLGGSGGERGYAVAVDVDGNARVSGWTASSNFPTVAPIQAVNGGLGDAFLCEFNAGGSALVYSTYLGGTTGSEHGYGLAIDSLGGTYVTGETSSTNFPTASPFQLAYGGSGDDAFVAKVHDPAAVPLTITATVTAVTGGSGANVMLSWTGSPGAASYELLRTGGTGLPFFAPTTSTTYVDTFAERYTAYLYRVRAVDAAGVYTEYGSPKLVTLVLFHDDPLVVSSTVVKAAHIAELQAAVNAVRTLAALPPFVFTDANFSSLPIKKVHIEGLRAALDEARLSLGLPALTYTDPVLTAGVTKIKAAHIEELRAGVK